jgi:hypothetical protein
MRLSVFGGIFVKKKKLEIGGKRFGLANVIMITDNGKKFATMECILVANCCFYIIEGNLYPHTLSSSRI